MKNTICRIFIFTGIFFLFGSPTLSFDAKVPAVIDLPDNISSVAIIDRSHSARIVRDFFERGIFQTAHEGFDPSTVCLDGLFNHLSEGEELVPVRTNLLIKRPGTGKEFSAPMEWDEVSSLCRQYRTDALLVLELFHVEILDDVAETKCGFRMYDPSEQRILDKFYFFYPETWGKKGKNDTDMGSANNESDAIYLACYRSGIHYGRRIVPSWYPVKRFYYDRSGFNHDLAEGARMMEVQDWDAAISAFRKAIESKHRKTRGRAAHNLAVVCEMQGNVDKALEWARIAWGKYKNKYSLEYATILDQRIQEINELKIQENKIP